MSKKQPVLGMAPDRLERACVDLGLKRFVAVQVCDWLYKKQAASFEDMTNISKANRVLLSDQFEVNPFKEVEVLNSKEQAVKYLFQLKTGAKVESVVLKEKTYNTLCISSQSGCPVDCKFCLTGIVGFKGQLSAAEIVAQLWRVNQDGHNISRVVFMGMGEPLLNYDNVIQAIDWITSEKGFGISKRKITVSTAGYIKGIQRLIEDEQYLNLAFSVGHADPIKRVKFMPIEERNPFVEVVKTIKEYQSLHNRKLTIEYTLLEGKNEDEKAIQDLIAVAKFLKAKINLINLNPHPKIPFKPVSEKVIHRAKDQIQAAKVPVTVRFRKGQDISAACGQLGESILKDALKNPE